MKKIKRITILCFLLAGMACNNKTEKLDISNLKGWEIAITKDAIPNEKYAAKEFQYLYKSATGIHLPVKVIKVDGIASVDAIKEQIHDSLG